MASVLRIFKNAIAAAWALALAVAIAPCGASASVDITGAPPSLSLGDSAEFTATVSAPADVESVELWYSLADEGGNAGAGWNVAAMAPGDADGEFVGVIPVLPAGTLSWYVRAVASGGAAEVSDTQTTVIATDFSYGIFHDMCGDISLKNDATQRTNENFYVSSYGWVQDTSEYGEASTNFYATAPNGTTWLASGIHWACHQVKAGRVPEGGSVVNVNSGTYPILIFLNLDPALKPFIRTPRLDSGLGTFSFDARKIAADKTSRLALEVSYDDDPVNWTRVKEWSLTASDVEYHCTNVVNDANVKYARILRTEKHTTGSTVYAGYIGIDNILATPVAPAVGFVSGGALTASPGLDDEIQVQCSISNAFDRIPAINRQVTVRYGLASAENAVVSSWASAEMEYSGESDGASLFTGTIPAQGEPLWLHFFFECSFDGYHAGSPESSGIVSPVYFSGSAAGTTSADPSGQTSHFAIQIRNSQSISIADPPEKFVNGEFSNVVAQVSSELDVSSVRFWYKVVDAAGHFTSDAQTFIEMSATGNEGEYACAVPILPQGTIEWHIEVECADGTKKRSSTQTSQISAAYSYDRFHDMKGIRGISTATGDFYDDNYGWVQDTSFGNASSNFYATAPNGSQWKASGVVWARAQTAVGRVPSGTTGIANVNAGTYPVLAFLNLAPEYKPYIRTPRLYDGLGVFSFDARNVAGQENRVALQVARVEDPTENDWRTIREWEFSTAAIYHCTNVVNDISVKYARILRTAENAQGSTIYVGFIGIDNIRATYPTPDVILRERLRNPGYPAVGQEIEVRCLVSNKYERIPATGKTVTVNYATATSERTSIPSSQWTELEMDYLCETNGSSLYVAKIPAQEETKWLHYFFKCEFGGYYVESPSFSGLASPEFLSGSTTSTANPILSGYHLGCKINAYKSRYSGVKLLQIVDGTGEATETDMALVDDNQWQISVPVLAGTRTESYFVGDDCYFDDADAFVIGSYYHGDEDQDEPFETPTGGSPERHYSITNGLPGIAIDVTDNGYMIYRFDDSNDDDGLNYTVKRGVFQTFDDWEVAATNFIRSLYGAGVGVNETSFDNWADPYDWTGLPDESMDEDFLSEGFVAGGTARTIYDDSNLGADTFHKNYGNTENSWSMEDARIVYERVRDTNLKDTTLIDLNVSTNAVFTNRVAHIKNGGYIANLQATLSMGVGVFTAQMRSAIGDGAIALYSGHGWTYSSGKPLQMVANFTLPPEDQADSHHYVSIVFDYKDAENFRELRVVRKDAAGTSDNRLALELWRTMNGAARRVAASSLVGNSIVTSGTTTYRLTVKLEPGSSPMRVKATVSLNSIWTNAVLNEDSNGWENVGANERQVGFCAFDCAPKFASLSVTGGDTGDNYTSAFNTEADRSVWTLGGEDPSNSSSIETAYRWYFDDANNLRRRIPKVNVRVYCPYDQASGNKSLIDTVPLNSLKYSRLSWNVHSCQPSYVQLSVESDLYTAYAVVDSVSLPPWRAATRGPDVNRTEDSYGWTAWSDQDSWASDPDNHGNWLIFEGWAKSRPSALASDISAAFQVSQADTNLVMALYSPNMTNGIGTVKFDYAVTGDGVSEGRVVYQIEYTDDLNGDTFNGGAGLVAAVYTNYVGQSGYRICDVAKNWGRNYDGDQIQMRMRIRVLPEYSDRDAVLWIDNAYVSDSPEESETMWKLYNGRLASAEDDPSRVFEGTGRTLVLNNSTSNDTEVAGVPQVYDDWEPYLQPPRIAQGIGEISFLYRTYASDGTPGGEGEICIVASPKEYTYYYDDEGVVTNSVPVPFEEWQWVTNITVTKSGYIKFDDPKIFRKGDKFVRIFSPTYGDGRGRVCIDNVLVTEPTRAGFDISYVALTPEQPVLSASERVAVTARVSREILKPTGIRLFVSWTESTGSWGYANWWNGARSAGRTIELVPGTEKQTYVTQPGSGLPASTANGTVQYVVWGIHDDVPAAYTFDDVYFEKDSAFVNPPWYGTMDLNDSHTNSASSSYVEGSTFSPYYLVYSCAPGSVWINEIWSAKNSSDTWAEDDSRNCQFVELAGPAGVDISGWQLNIYYKGDGPTEPRREYVIPQNTVLPNTSNGWGFYVIGDKETPNVGLYTTADGVENSTELLFFHPTKSKNYGTNPIGMELQRQGGIFEERVHIGNSHQNFVGNNNAEFDDSFVWLGIGFKDAKSGSYSLLDDGTSETIHTNKLVTPETYWYWGTATPTPGAPNVGQTLPSMDSSSYRFVSAIIDGALFGTQNDSRDMIDIEVSGGGQVSVAYVAGDWYKIVSLTSNGTPVAGAAGKSSFTFEVASMSANVNNEVTFGPKSASDYAGEAEASRWTDAILDWFRSRGWSESDIAAALASGDGDDYDIWQEFLLNTDPTVFTEVDARTTAISLDGDTLSLDLGLARTDGGSPVSLGINGVVNVYGLAELGGAETKLAAAQLASGSFSGTETESVEIDTAELGLNFFRWRIEEQ
ncbi:MAG: hypothetical protein IKH04_06560 [Kiritimatiellae bacterium]|nr:hypothetical protein [Kiritimatiellia bacterium]